MATGQLHAVLFDRDGTLIVDVPYNGDPTRVAPMPTAHDAVDLLRSRGIALGVVSNQSGIARGLVSEHEVNAVNTRVDELFGGFDVWRVCPHGPSDGCPCRKPQPGLVRSAASALRVSTREVAVIGDIGADVGAARAAGASHVLVPTSITRSEEIDDADRVATTLLEAVQLLLDERSPA